MERRLAAVLATDVVGYSRLIRQNEMATLAALKTDREELIEPTIAERSGRIVKLMGDGILAEFPSAVEAVRCAVDLQRLIAKRGESVAEERRITYRIGINIGDIVVEDDDIYGDGVNIAARLEGLAEPNEIFISDKVYEEVRDRMGLAFEDLGEREIKNIDRPVRVFRVLPGDKAGATPSAPTARKKMAKTWPAVAAVALLVAISGGGVWWWQSQQLRVVPADPAKMAFKLPEKPSIAVLPFVNMSDEAEQEIFVDGLTEDLITDLSKVSDLFVIARNSTFVYKGQAVPVRQVSEDLGVRYVLEGSVRRVSDTVRINAQLIDATTGGHLWAERYDGNATDIFEVQDGFVREIVSALALNLSEGAQKEMQSGQTSNIEAREAFQNGWEHYLRYTAEDNATAAGHFKRAAELDPEYGRAYSALGMVYVRGCQWRWNRNLGLSPGEAFDTAVDFLTKGEEHSSSMTKVAASQIYLYDGDNDKAFTEAARAVRQDPNDPEAQVAMGLAMITTGRPEAGLEFIEAALRLSPSHPTHYVLARAMAYFTMNDLEQTADILAAALERDPGAADLAPILAASYAHLGRREEAHAALRVWKPEAGQAELQTELSRYHFPYTFSVGRAVLNRLTAGLEIAALPGDVTVDSLIVTLQQSETVIERRSAARKLGILGPAAKPAVPALQALLDDPAMKYTVEQALEKIIGK